MIKKVKQKLYIEKFNKFNKFDKSDPFHKEDFEFCKNYFNTDKLIKIVDADAKDGKGTLEEMWDERDIGLKERGKELPRKDGAEIGICLDACWEIDVFGEKGLIFQNASPFYIAISKESADKLKDKLINYENISSK